MAVLWGEGGAQMAQGSFWWRIWSSNLKVLFRNGRGGSSIAYVYLVEIREADQEVDKEVAYQVLKPLVGKGA